jgi:hypothetical protein
MGKKKKKKGKSISLLDQVDSTLECTHDDLMKEIEEMQLKIAIADDKARRQAKKLAKKKGGKFYDYDKLKKEARLEVVGDMENKNFLERITEFLSDITPIVILIGRLVASLILSILSIDTVKLHIKPQTLKKLDSVYNKAMSYGK